MNEPDPPKKSKFTESWKSLAGNLFGVQFDGSSDLDEIDIDSVAEAVEQINATGQKASKQPTEAAVNEEDLGFGEENLSFDADEQASEEESSQQSVEIQNEAPESPETKSKNEDFMNGDSDKTFDRATFEDEDPFGFGIAEEEMVDFDEDDEPDSNENDLDETAEQAPEETQSVETSEQLEEEDLSFDPLLDFDSDDEKQAEEPVKAKESSVETPKKAPRGRSRRSKKPQEQSQAETEAGSEQTETLKKNPSDQDDGFWDSLEDWDSSASGKSEKSDSPQKRREPRRSSSPRRSEEPAKPAKAEQEVTEEAESESGSDETEQESRPKRSRRRRRRPTRSRKNENQSEETTSDSESKDVAAEDIDLLWGSEDDQSDLVLPSKKKEAISSRTDSRQGRKSRTPRTEDDQTSRSQSDESDARENDGERESSESQNLHTLIKISLPGLKQSR